MTAVTATGSEASDRLERVFFGELGVIGEGKETYVGRGPSQ